MENDKNQKEDTIRKICDKKVVEALQMIEVANSDRAETIKSQIIQLFQRTNKFITYEMYVEMVSKSRSETEVKIHRRTEDDELADIDDI